MRLKGIKRAQVNAVSGSATIEYDERLINLKQIKSVIRDCGYHCAASYCRKHLCVPEDPTGEAKATEIGAELVLPHPSIHAEHPEAKKTAPIAKKNSRPRNGHGAGMDLGRWQGICVIVLYSPRLYIPIFIYSPMGGLSIRPRHPLV